MSPVLRPIKKEVTVSHREEVMELEFPSGPNCCLTRALERKPCPVSFLTKGELCKLFAAGLYPTGRYTGKDVHCTPFWGLNAWENASVLRRIAYKVYTAIHMTKYCSDGTRKELAS